MEHEVRKRLRQLGERILKNSSNELYLSMRFLDVPLSELNYELRMSSFYMGTDGSTIYYNPRFVIEKYAYDSVYVNRSYLHMLFHSIFRHMYLKEERDEEKWNLACDIAVEYIIDGLDNKATKRLVSSRREELYERLSKELKVFTAEGIYHLLQNNWFTEREIVQYSVEFLVCDHQFWRFGTSSNKAKNSENSNQDENSDSKKKNEPEEKELNSKEQSKVSQTKEQSKESQTKDQSRESQLKDQSKENQTKKQTGDGKQDKEQESKDKGKQEGKNEDKEDKSKNDSSKEDELKKDVSKEDSSKEEESEKDSSKEDNSKENRSKEENSNEDKSDNDTMDHDLEREANKRKAQENRWKDISDKLKTNLETYQSNNPKATESLLKGIGAANREIYDYQTFLQKFAVYKERLQVDMDSFDYGFYSYGIEHYGNIPFIEPLEYKDEKRVEEIVIAIDTSGSCASSLIYRFLKETIRILKNTETFHDKFRIHLIQCDEEIKEHKILTDLMELNDYMEHFQVKGFGNTDFRPVFEYINELKHMGELKRLKGLLYFTDGYGIFPSKQPEYETAFIFVRNQYVEDKVPTWAMKVVLEEEQIEKMGE